MRVVLDTNILVRAVLSPHGAAGAALSYLRAGKYTALYSEPLVEELRDVLSRDRLRRRYLLTDDDVAAITDLLNSRGEACYPEQTIAICRDPKDNAILEAAVAGGAELIVSADNDLLVLHPFGDIPIIAPDAFLALLRARDSERE